MFDRKKSKYLCSNLSRQGEKIVCQQIYRVDVLNFGDGDCSTFAGGKSSAYGAEGHRKNILAENLAYIFQRPTYNVSFHVNTNSGDLIGTDTFKDNEVKLRKGSIYQCAEYGGFGILDEINMAKNDAVSVLHATLDYRRSIDVPGYKKIDLHPAARFIGTMNYGYAGTKELNEALDLRGLLAAMRIVETGLSPWQAVKMGVVNKTFDVFEKDIIEDAVRTRIPPEWTKEDVYE